jgi:maltose-binding protein MalE
MPPELLGPAGLAVGALIAVAALWREHTKSDQRERDLTNRALTGWEAQTAATNRLAEAVEEQAREHADRRRRGDP